MLFSKRALGLAEVFSAGMGGGEYGAPALAPEERKVAIIEASPNLLAQSSAVSPASMWNGACQRLSDSRYEGVRCVSGLAFDRPAAAAYAKPETDGAE